MNECENPYTVLERFQKMNNHWQIVLHHFPIIQTILFYKFYTTRTCKAKGWLAGCKLYLSFALSYFFFPFSPILHRYPSNITFFYLSLTIFLILVSFQRSGLYFILAFRVYPCAHLHLVYLLPFIFFT